MYAIKTKFCHTNANWSVIYKDTNNAWNIVSKERQQSFHKWHSKCPETMLTYVQTSLVLDDTFTILTALIFGRFLVYLTVRSSGNTQCPYPLKPRYKDRKWKIIKGCKRKETMNNLWLPTIFPFLWQNTHMFKNNFPGINMFSYCVHTVTKRS
jgi:hypothetical protein